MDCPTCGKSLRQIQVEKMLGNPEYHEWCRNGYCSLQCFEEKSPSNKPIELIERPKQSKTAGDSASHSAPTTPREPKAYTFATVSIIAVPFAMLIGWIGSGSYEIPAASLFFLVLIGIILTSGLTCGILALAAIPKLGGDGLLWKSVIGITLILAFTWLCISGFYYARAEQAEKQNPHNHVQPE